MKENIKAPRHWPYSPHKWPVTRTMFPFEEVIMNHLRVLYSCNWQSTNSFYLGVKHKVHVSYNLSWTILSAATVLFIISSYASMGNGSFNDKWYHFLLKLHLISYPLFKCAVLWIPHSVSSLNDHGNAHIVAPQKLHALLSIESGR